MIDPRPTCLRGSSLLALLAGCLLGCGSSTEKGLSADEATSKTVGPAGGTISKGTLELDIPQGALARDVNIVVVTTSAAVALDLKEVSVGGVTREVQLASPRVSLTPHGTSFSTPVRLKIPYSGNGDVLLRLEDDQDTSWEVVEGATLADGIATVSLNGFSVYAVARWTSSDESPDGGGLLPPPDAGSPIATRPWRGEPVIEVYDNGGRGASDNRLHLDGGSLFWVDFRNGKLAIKSALVRGSGPAAAKTVFEVPFVASGGWDDPRLLVTSEHLVLPVIGAIEKDGQLIDTDGFSSVKKDGTGFRLKIMENWWLVARGPNLIYANFKSETFSLSPADGQATLIPNIESPCTNSNAVYDAATDEMGCLSEGSIVSYDFGTRTVKTIATSSVIKGPPFGAPALAYNATHWFAPITLPSGPAIGAYPRDGSGTLTRYETLEALGPILVDDQYMYACLAGELTRVSLTDQSKRVLTEDCGGSFGVSNPGRGRGPHLLPGPARGCDQSAEFRVPLRQHVPRLPRREDCGEIGGDPQGELTARLGTERCRTRRGTWGRALPRLSARPTTWRVRRSGCEQPRLPGIPLPKS